MAISSSFLGQLPAQIAVVGASLLCLPQSLVALFLCLNINLFFFSSHKHLLSWVSFNFPPRLDPSETDMVEHLQLLSPASQRNVLTSLHLQHSILYKSAAPSVASAGITMDSDLELSFRFPGDIPQENILVKPTFKSLPAAVPLQKKSNNKSKGPQFSCIAFFFLLSLLWHVPVGIHTRQIDFFPNVNILFHRSVAYCIIIIIIASFRICKTQMLAHL